MARICFGMEGAILGERMDVVLLLVIGWGDFLIGTFGVNVCEER